ncbi:MAG: hypothetical protein G01um101438_441 [Parcubacteria group bacterium Gr01-1014_38]|nr:MAG: hypothetical protein G01um101438_441 [Parcubacteria group bacterium Gr01-1014_38]
MLIANSDAIALTVLAGLLSLLPVVVLFWVYYLKEGEPSVPGRVVLRFFATGMLTVLPAILLERGVYLVSRQISPIAASAFFTEFFTLERVTELFVAFALAFGVVALVEEGVRYVLLRVLFQRAVEIDQIVDGVQVGMAAGLGFAFVENTLYFLRLFQGFEFGTLAVVFFLRFLISTFGHIAFGGLMGYELAKAFSHPLGRSAHLRRAFWIPWVTHGLFDFLLSIRLSAYTVVFLILPLLYLWFLYHTPQFSERFRLSGRVLRAPIRGRPWFFPRWRRPPVDVLPMMPWCPTCLQPLPEQTPPRSMLRRLSGFSLQCPSCGVTLYRRPGWSPGHHTRAHPSLSAP